MLKQLFILITLTYTCSALAEPNRYLAVYDDSITPGYTEKHILALQNFKLAKEKTDYAASYIFFQMNNGHIPAFHAVASPDYNAADDAEWEKNQHQFDSEFLNKNSEIYSQSIAEQNFYLIEFKPELSYQADFKWAELPYLLWQEFNIAGTTPGKDESINSLKLMKALDQKVNTPIHYRVYSKRHGPHLPVVMIMYFAKSKADFEKTMHQTEILRGAEGAALIQRAGLYRELLSESEGTFIPSVSY